MIQLKKLYLDKEKLENMNEKNYIIKNIEKGKKEINNKILIINKEKNKERDKNKDFE